MQRSRIGRVYIDIKIANNTKINHITVSFTDHHNTISVDRLPSKTKIVKVSWYFNNSLLCKPEFSLVTKTFFLTKKTKTTTLQQVTGGNNTPMLELELFLKVPPLKKILVLRLNEDCKTYTKKKTSNQNSTSDWKLKT